MRGAGGAVWGVVTALTAPSVAAQTVDLRFTRDASLRGCPDEALFRAVLEQSHVPIARGPDDPRPGPNGVNLVDVRYLPGPRPGAVRVEVQTFAGAVVRDAFTHPTTQRDCADSPRVIALRIAYLLRPVRAEPADTPPAVAAAPASAAPAPVATTVALPMPPQTPARPTPSAARVAVVAYVGGGATFLGVPAVEPDVVLGIGVGGARWRLRAQAVIGLPRDIDDGVVRWSARRWLGDIAVCWMPRWLGLCGGVQAGSFEVERRSSGAPWSAALPQVSVVARVLFDQSMVGRLRVWAAIDLSVQLVIPQLQSGEAGALRAQWASDGLGLGAAGGVSVELF